MPRLLVVVLLLILASVLGWIGYTSSQPPAGSSPPPRDEATTDNAEPGAPSAAHAAAPQISVARSVLPAATGHATAAAAPPPDGSWQLVGRVFDHRGKPVPEARVRLVPGFMFGAWGWGEFRSEDQDLARTHTAGDGSFSMRLATAPFPGRTAWRESQPSLVAEAATGAPAALGLPTAFIAHGGECELILPDGAAIRGRVLCPDGAPAARCRVSSSSGLWWATDDEGVLRVGLPEAEQFDLRFSHDSGVAVLNCERPPAGADLDLGEVTLRGSARLTGRVVLSDGSPASHVWMRFEAVAPQGAEGHVTAHQRADADGRFDLRGLSAGPYEVNCVQGKAMIPLRPRDADAQTPNRLTAGPESDGHLLELPWRLLVVDVPWVDPDAFDLSHQIQASIVAGLDPPNANDFRLLVEDRVRPSHLPIVFLYDEATWIRVQAATLGGWRGAVLQRFPPEPWLHRITLDLQPESGTGVIRVRCARADLQLHRFTASLHDPRTGLLVLNVHPRRNDEEVQLRQAPAGEWTLKVRANDPSAGAFLLEDVLPVEVRVGEITEVEWSPREGGQLKVVVDTDGTGAAEGEVPNVTGTVVSGPAHVGETLLFVDTGRWPLVTAPALPVGSLMTVAAPLEPGLYRIRFEAPGFTPREEEIEVRAGNVVRLDTRLTARD